MKRQVYKNKKTHNMFITAVCVYFLSNYDGQRTKVSVPGFNINDNSDNDDYDNDDDDDDDDDDYCDDDVEVEEEEVRDEEDWGEGGGLRRTEEEVEDGKNDDNNDS